MTEKPNPDAGSTSDRELVTSRIIDAPPERVFNAFSDPAHLKTRVGWRQLFNSADERQRIAKFAVEANEQNLDRLAAQVAEID